MNVKELIEFLQGQPQDMPVAYRCYSEACLMDLDELFLSECCEARPDGWVQNARPDKEGVTYLIFPGN